MNLRGTQELIMKLLMQYSPSWAHFRGSHTSTASRRSYGLKSLNLIGPRRSRFVYNRKGHYTIKITFFSKLGLMK